MCAIKKSLANRITSDPRIIIHHYKCIILFHTLYFMSWTHNSTKSNHQSLISPLLLRTVSSDFALWRHHSWSVASHERGVLALWRHIHWLFLDVQIGGKPIFTSEQQPWILISHRPVFTAWHVRNCYIGQCYNGTRLYLALTGELWGGGGGGGPLWGLRRQLFDNKTEVWLGE